MVLRELEVLPAAKPGEPGVFRMYRAADMDHTCQKVLCLHAEETRAEHVQGSLCERISAADLAKLQKLVDMGVKKFQARRGVGRLSAEEKKKMGKSLFQRAMQVCRKAKYVTRVPCVRCGQACRPHPSKEERKKSVYVMVAGTTCVSWSSLGSSAGWLHQSTVPFSIWLEDVWRQRPTFVIHECTRALDWESMRLYMEPRYVIEQLQCTPLDFGVPVKRARSYAVMTLKTAVVMQIPWARSSWEELELMQAVESTGRIFWRAPKSLVERFCSENARPEQVHAEVGSPRATLTTAALQRLEDHLWFHRVAGAKFACIAYNQRLEFMTFDAKVPTLTRSSTIWGSSLDETGTTSASIDRPLLPVELLGCQGWPVMLAADDERTRRLPLPFRYQHIHSHSPDISLSDAEIHRLAGNGMHVLQIGAALAWTLLCTSSSG